MIYFCGCTDIYIFIIWRGDVTSEEWDTAIEQREHCVLLEGNILPSASSILVNTIQLFKYSAEDFVSSTM